MSRSNNFATSGTDLATIQLSQKLNKRKRDKERVKREREKERVKREREYMAETKRKMFSAFGTN